MLLRYHMHVLPVTKTLNVISPLWLPEDYVFEKSQSSYTNKQHIKRRK